MPDMSHAYLLGLFFIALVCIIWSASSLLTQYIYTERSFHSPFLLTYIGVSLFSLWLPVWYARHAQAVLDPEGIEELPTIASDDQPDPSAAGRVRRQHERAERHDDGAMSDAPYFRSSPPPSYEAVPLHSGAAHRKWTQSDHFYAAARIAPVWFLANWCYNSSLAYTSITSSTVLASTGSVFTFLFAVCSGDERFGWVKLIGVLLGVSGSVATAFTDVSNADTDDAMTPSSLQAAGCEDDACFEKPLLGDFLGLMSAIGYGVYAVQTRLYCPHDESLYSMQLLLGYIGLICMVGLSPIALWQWTGVKMSLEVFGFLAVKGLFDNVLSDYLWLRAVILTSATVATVGLGLTIPLAFMSDLWQGAEDVITFGSVSGALLVLFGFVLVNHGTEDEHANDHLRTMDRPRESQELSNLSHESLRPLNSWDDDEEDDGAEEDGSIGDAPSAEHGSPQA
jgi:solute carrier family 35, member F5